MNEKASSQDIIREPRTRRVRRVGVHANYWYAVEREDAIGPGEIREVRFWGESIALFRGEDNELRAVENRCAHRQLPLTAGIVQGPNIACQYHGWTYNGCGQCVSVSHELGKNRSRLPKIKIRSYPLKVAYGLVWLFPGDPSLACSTPLPQIPQLQGSDPWPMVPIDVTINAHFSMVVENVCDFNHAFLHRNKQPFTTPVLRKHWREDNTVHVLYDTSFHESRISRLLAEQEGLDEIHLWYQYPYQGSDIAGKYLHWLFMLPEDERTTRCFFIFLFGPIRIPGTPLTLPRFMKPLVLTLANRMYIKPLLAEDKFALEQEQLGFDRHSDKPFIELNPIVADFQTMTLERWDDWQSEADSVEVRLRRSGRRTVAT